MTVEKSVKVVLNSEEEKCLHKALDIINEIWTQTRDYGCDVEFDDEENYNLLDEMHSTISVII